MAVINVATKEIHAKVVYYGPGFSGKTTNLEYIYRRVPKESKGEMLSLATETERTLFFDFLHLDVAQVRGFTVRFHLYTTPGQQLYERTRFAVLNGADGVVFVADAERERLRDNVDSLKELAQNLCQAGQTIPHFPADHAIQQDRPARRRCRCRSRQIPQPDEGAALRVGRHPGQGVFETLRGICRLVTNQL